ncbi:helix-turn-helix transcriptional regulator [Pelomonas sp. KK5]|uniref:helix-turn-helix transcriptional regulator n=1 Tax=Pelomonas sp. KK5 TaxID=1855730 RepID=UPI001301E64F|nr:helix-turn-helix transcriptional regulator [Pelomonas sp. KK5]
MLELEVADGDGSNVVALREREAGAAAALALDATLMVAILNEIDYPLFVLSQALVPLHINKAAQALLGGALPGQHRPEDRARLAEAIDGALQRGRRNLVTVQLAPGDRHPTPLAVIPQRDSLGRAAVLLIVAKPQLCPELTLQGYARAINLTDRETLVLQGLWAGLTPEEIARERGVALSTVRSQLSSLRAKTGAKDLKGVTQRIGMLPPLVHALAGKV